MSVRTPYVASSLGHVVALGLLVTISALQRPAPMIPNVRIVALTGGGRPGPKAAPAVVKAPPAPVAAPKPVVPAPVELPKPKAKPAEKTPPPKAPARAAEARGMLPPEKREIVSKSPPAAPAKPQAPAPGTVAAAAAAGDGARNPAGRSVGVEADGDPGPLSGYLGLLRDKVAANWTPPLAVARRGEVRAVVYFVVARDGGAPRDLAVAVSSGDGNFDRSAMRAVAYANPLPPLPGNWDGESIGIRFTFYQEY